MNKKPIVFAKDIARILDCSLRKAQKMVQDIKAELNKEKHQVVTAREFANYVGIELEEVRARL